MNIQRLLLASVLLLATAQALTVAELAHHLTLAQPSESHEQSKFKKDPKYLYIPKTNPKSYLGDNTPSPRIMKYLPLTNKDGEIQPINTNLQQVKKHYLNKLKYDKTADQTKVNQLAAFFASEMGQSVLTYFDGLARSGLNFYKLSEANFRKWMAIKIVSGNDVKMYARTIAQDADLFKEFYTNARNRKIIELNVLLEAPKSITPNLNPLDSTSKAQPKQNAKVDQTSKKTDKKQTKAQNKTVKPDKNSAAKDIGPKKIVENSKTKKAQNSASSKQNNSNKTSLQPKKQQKPAKTNKPQDSTKQNSLSNKSKDNKVTKPSESNKSKVATTQNTQKVSQAKQNTTSNSAKPTSDQPSKVTDTKNLKQNKQNSQIAAKIPNQQKTFKTKEEVKGVNNLKTQNTPKKEPSKQILWSNTKQSQYIQPKQVVAQPSTPKKPQNSPLNKTAIEKKATTLPDALLATYQFKKSDIQDLTISQPPTTLKNVNTKAEVSVKPKESQNSKVGQNKANNAKIQKNPPAKEAKKK